MFLSKNTEKKERISFVNACPFWLISMTSYIGYMWQYFQDEMRMSFKR